MSYKKHITGQPKPKSKFKGVSCKITGNGSLIVWMTAKTHKGQKKYSVHQTERQAALAYDKILINFGLEPVNILKRKSK